jgi:hypothetical protein
MADPSRCGACTIARPPAQCDSRVAGAPAYRTKLERLGRLGPATHNDVTQTTSATSTTGTRTANDPVAS